MPIPGQVLGQRRPDSATTHYENLHAGEYSLSSKVPIQRGWARAVQARPKTATMGPVASRFFRSGSNSATAPERLGVLGPHRIVVPVRGAPVDEDALRAACRLARPAKARILVIAVLEVPRHLPLGVSLSEELAEAEGLLGRMEDLATQLGSKVDTVVLQAREAGSAVVDEARRWDADLMVVGLGEPPKFGEFSLDRTAAELLSRVRCRLIMIRPALDAAATVSSLSLPGSPD